MAATARAARCILARSSPPCARLWARKRSSASAFPATNSSTAGSTRRRRPRSLRRLVRSGQVDYVSVTAGNNTFKLARVDHWPPTPAPFGAFRHLSRAVKIGGRRSGRDGRARHDARAGRRDTGLRRRRSRRHGARAYRRPRAVAEIARRQRRDRPALHRRQCLHQLAARAQAADLSRQPRRGPSRGARLREIGARGGAPSSSAPARRAWRPRAASRSAAGRRRSSSASAFWADRWRGGRRRPRARVSSPDRLVGQRAWPPRRDR